MAHEFPTQDARSILRLALAEDCGTGDVTCLLTVPEGHTSSARIVAKESGVFVGGPLFALVFEELAALVPDSQASNVTFNVLVKEGDAVRNGQTVANISGPTQAILQAERTLLNLLQRLSGSATVARTYQEAAGPNCKVLDTRKTTPGLRQLEKYAIRMAGGSNHRMGLWDTVLIKENHARAAGGVRPAAVAALAGKPDSMPLIVEVESLEQLDSLCGLPITRVLLDNFTPDQIRKAVELRTLRNATFALEASGGITLETIAAYAQAGAEYISVGALTHSVKALDLSLLLESN
jgi:nicotinate-nucleotide pyrophosphorylase (carboxylating)